MEASEGGFGPWLISPYIPMVDCRGQQATIINSWLVLGYTVAGEGQLYWDPWCAYRPISASQSSTSKRRLVQRLDDQIIIDQAQDTATAVSFLKLSLPLCMIKCFDVAEAPSQSITICLPFCFLLVSCRHGSFHHTRFFFLSYVNPLRDTPTLDTLDIFILIA